MKTSRELVYETLEFKNPEQALRDLWALPWAETDVDALMIMDDWGLSKVY